MNNILNYDFLFYLILLLSFLPIITVIALNRKFKTIKKQNAAKSILVIAKKIFTYIVLAAILMSTFIIINGTKVDNVIVNYNITYFACLISLFFYFNYFSTSSLILRIRVEEFLQAINQFFKDNYILNLVLVLVYIFLNQLNNDLFLSLIGAYMFYILTEINNNYKNSKKKVTTYSRVEIGLHTVMNVLFVCFFAFGIEPLLKYMFLKQRLTSTNLWYFVIALIIFEVIIIINYFKSSIDKFVVKIIKYIKK